MVNVENGKRKAQEQLRQRASELMLEGPTESNGRAQQHFEAVAWLSLQDAGLLVQLFQMEQTLFRPIHYRLTDGADIKLITRCARRHARELKLTRSRLPVTLLIRADEFCFSQHAAMHCSLDLRFRRAF